MKIVFEISKYWAFGIAWEFAPWFPGIHDGDFKKFVFAFLVGRIQINIGV